MDSTPLERDSEPAASIVGRSLGDYRITREIASGGMAAVYLGHKSGPGGFSQAAAVKVIHPHMARDPEFVDMFLDEARIASHINHPNVCRVFDFGNSEETYYLAMEYVLGETWALTLETLLSRTTDRETLAAIVAQIVAQACEGLHAAHEARTHDGIELDIVHRDVSPQNLAVGYDGGVRVLDFGIARAADRLHTTRTGTVKGRYSYMSPEQMRGQPVDRRADIWSLGVILREGLTGKRLFRRQTDAETIIAVTQQPIPPWDEPVPRALRAIVEKAVQHDPNRRYATARDMSVDLRRFVNSQPITMGMPELSTWMHRLFATRIDAKRNLLSDGGTSPADPASSPDADARSQPTVRDLGRTPVSAQHSVSGVQPVTRSGATQAPAFGGDMQRRSWLLRGAAAAAAVLLAWILLQSVPMGDDEPIEIAVNAETAPRVQPIPTAAAKPEEEPKEIWSPNELPLAEAVEGESGTRAPVQKRSSESVTNATPPRRTTKAEQPPAEAPVAVKPGAVNVVTTNGWATVSAQGRQLGTTPGRFELPAGTHVLTLKRMGTGTPEHHSVMIRSGKVAKLRVELR